MDIVNIRGYHCLINNVWFYFINTQYIYIIYIDLVYHKTSYSSERVPSVLFSTRSRSPDFHSELIFIQNNNAIYVSHIYPKLKCLSHSWQNSITYLWQSSTIFIIFTTIILHIGWMIQLSFFSRFRSHELIKRSHEHVQIYICLAYRGIYSPVNALYLSFYMFRTEIS